MVNYQNGKVYKIEPVIEHEEGDIYIGSTTKAYLSQRMDTHRSKYKIWQLGKYDKVQVFDLFNKYGVENCKIILIELVDANCKEELLAREAHYIKTLNCVNKRVPFRTNEEKKQLNHDYKAEYYEKNKDAIKARIKDYKILNKEKIKQQMYKVCDCECGSTYTHQNYKRHCTSKKHIEYIKENEIKRIK